MEGWCRRQFIGGDRNTVIRIGTLHFMRKARQQSCITTARMNKQRVTSSKSVKAADGMSIRVHLYCVGQVEMPDWPDV